MTTPTKNPHQLFFFAVPVLLLIGTLSGESAADINIYDTYFVISYLHLSALLVVLFGIAGLGYWIMQKTDRKLSPALTWVHMLLTFGGIILIIILSQLYRDDILDYSFNYNLDIAIKLIILLIIFGQLLIAVNFIYGLINKRKTKHP